MELKIKKLSPNAFVPQRATAGSAGADLRALCNENGITIEPMQRALVPTGLAIELPGADSVALIFARSGLSIKQGLCMANGVGVIDSDYRGELCVPLVNLGSQPVHIQNGDRVAQLVLMPVILPEISEISVLTETTRGEGGFGSTGLA